MLGQPKDAKGWLTFAVMELVILLVLTLLIWWDTKLRGQ